MEGKSWRPNLLIFSAQGTPSQITARATLNPCLASAKQLHVKALSSQRIQCNTSSDRNTVILVVSSWLRKAFDYNSRYHHISSHLLMNYVKRALQTCQVLILKFSFIHVRQWTRRKMDIPKPSAWQEVPLPPFSVINDICWVSWGGSNALDTETMRPSLRAQPCETIWRKRHLSAAQKLAFKNNFQVCHIKNCKLQLKIKEDRKLMKIHFGKQWRQLKKCQETAQGSKPESEPGHTLKRQHYLLVKMSGGGGSFLHILQTATIFHSMKSSGDIYFQNYSWAPSIKHFPFHTCPRLCTHNNKGVSQEVPQTWNGNNQLLERESRQTYWFQTISSPPHLLELTRISSHAEELAHISFCTDLFEDFQGHCHRLSCWL